MKHNYIGKTGLRVSNICMGTMTFGSSADKAKAFKIMDKAFDAGVNFFDTAEIYPVPPKAEYAGETEKIVGEWLKTKPRDAIILATKVVGAANGWFVPPIRHGLTAIDRFHIERAIEGSLKRLGTDYIDLYQVHWPDTLVPIEESLEALSRLVDQGKVRYLGTSNDSTYGLTKANEVAKYEGLKRFESIQNNFSFLNPRFLDELAHVCRKEAISLLPYSPIGGGVLSGKYNFELIPVESRFVAYLKDGNPRLKAMKKRFVNEKTLATTARFMEIAKKYRISPVTLAVAYTLDFDFVPSTIIGARTADQLDESLAGSSYKISDEMRAELEAIQADILYPMG